jgi:hypothetical protein
MSLDKSKKAYNNDKVHGDWTDNAQKQVKIAIEKFGKPDFMVYSKNGMAIWSKDQLSNTPFCSILVKDEYSYVKCGKDLSLLYWQVTISYDVTHSKNVISLISLNPPICIDFLSKTMSARGATFEHCLASLVVATSVSCGSVDSKVVKHLNSFEEASNAVHNNPEMETKFLKQLEVNLQLKC